MLYIQNLYGSLFCLLCILHLIGCGIQQPSINNPKFNNTAIFHGAVKVLTETMVHDIFSPPHASRTYSYSSIAAYEVLIQKPTSSFLSLSNQLNDFKGIPQYTKKKPILYSLASIYAYLYIGKALVFSEDPIKTYQDSVIAYFQKHGASPSLIYRSINYASLFPKLS